MIEILAPTTHPLVGQEYQVPCVLTEFWGALPVLGPQHDDRDYLNNPERHWHVDLRFFDDDLLRRWAHQDTPDAALALRLGIAAADVQGTITMRMLVCKRAMPEYKTDDKLFWLPALEAAYSRARVKNNLCPHKQMPLVCAPDSDGVVTCSGHGLRWNVKTGRLVPRFQVKLPWWQRLVQEVMKR